MNLSPGTHPLSGLKALIIPIAILLFQTAATAVYAQNASATKQQEPPPAMELQVADPINTRYGLMAFTRGIDSEFVYKRGPDVNGQEEFSAKDQYNTSVEIIGSDRHPQTVKWTIAFTANRQVNIKEALRLEDFLQIIGGPEAVQWFSEQTQKNLSAHPLDDYTETKEFEGRKIRFEYRPRLRQASMMVFMGK